MDKVTKVTNARDPMLETVDTGIMMANMTSKNKAHTEQRYQNLYKPIYSDPFTTGRAAIKISSSLNKFGVNHFSPTPEGQTYNVGLSTGGGKYPFPPQTPRSRCSMSG